MAGYNFMKDEDHRAFMLLVNLPLDPLWLDIHQRYPLCLEDGSWNPKYYYNGKWRQTLEALKDRLAVDFNQFQEAAQATTQPMRALQPPPLEPSEGPSSSMVPAAGDDDCQIIFEYPARRRRSFEYEWWRFTDRVCHHDQR